MPSRVVCFVCGSLGGEFGQLHSRPPQGRKGDKIGFDGIKGAYFPFLEHHDPPQGCRQPDAEGLVDSCRVCHAFLTQQWANYERSNTPAVKRLYWLKRLDDGQFTGAEMKLQGEYMAQVMGLQYQPASDVSSGVGPPQALSPDSRDGFKGDSGRAVSQDSEIPAQGKRQTIREVSGQYGGGGSGVLDLSVSIKSEPSLARQPQKLSQDSSIEKLGQKANFEERNQKESQGHRPHKEKLPQPVKPELDEYMFVCYTCGVESSGVAAKFVSSRVHAPGEPHFPFLARLVPSEGASPMTNQGICRVCDLCFSSLCHQWLAYEQHGTPSSARIFRLNNLFFSNDASLSMSGAVVGGRQKEENNHCTQNGNRGRSTPSGDGNHVTAEEMAQRFTTKQREDRDDIHHGNVREVCYLCSQLWSPLKMCPLYTTPATSAVREEDQMYFPFIRELRRPQGARPLNPDGSVRVCISCSGNLQAQWQQYQRDGTPTNKRRYSLLSSTAHIVPSAHAVSSPQQQPFIESVKSPDHSHVSSRHLEKSEAGSKLSLNQPLHLDIGKEDSNNFHLFHSFSKSPASGQNRATVMPHYPAPQISSSPTPDLVLPGVTSESKQPSTLPLSSTLVPSSSSSSLNTIPHPLQQAGERPKKVCFLCGEKCLSSKSQVLYAYPARHVSKTIAGSLSSSHIYPFFPFIASREPAPNSEPMAEDGGIVSCSYCYFSLLNQWRDYEEGVKRTQQPDYTSEGSDNRWMRKYSLTEFACFVCGNVDVPRRSMRTLEVHKFGFLREHRAPPQALVMMGGESVGCCSLCHYSLTHQLAEYERLGLPAELRKYNWTVQQPGAQQHQHLDENSCDTQDSIQDSHGLPPGPTELHIHTGSEAEDSNHGPPGGSKPSLNVPGSPHVEVGKLPPKTATVPPLNHHTNAGGNLASSSSSSTMRTSGFAAALRKLAHQAKDSTDDSSLNQTSSPPDSHSPRDMTSKLRGQGSSQLNFPAWPLSSAPVVTIAPTQTYPAHHQHKSRSHERATLPALSGSHKFEQQPPHRHHHHHHQSQHQEPQHRPASPSSKFDSGREQSHHNRQAPPTSHAREDDWTKDGRGSRSSSRITPQAPTSSPPNSGSFSLSNQALSNPSLTSQALSSHGLTREALDVYARGFPSYRPEDEALRLSLAGAGLPYGIDPAAYAAYAAAAAAYHPAILQQQAALAAHSPYRFEDPLLLERYRLLHASSPYLPFSGLTGLSSLAGLGLHPALAAAAAAGPLPQFSPGHLPPPELLQRYSHPYLGDSAGQHSLLDPLLDPRLAAAQAAMLERTRLEGEKARELREIDRNHEDRKKVSAPSSNSSSRGREPGEREHNRHPSYESHSAASEISAGQHDRIAAQELAHHRLLAEQRNLRRSQQPHPHQDKSFFSETKMSSSDYGLRESRGNHESSKDSHVKYESSKDAHIRHEALKDSHVGNSRPRLSPHSPYTHIIKPYDRIVDQQLSLGESALGAKHHGQDPPHDKHGRLSSSSGEQIPTTDKHKPKMLSPPLERLWSSISSTSSSTHQNHSHHHPHQHHQSISQVNKDRSSSDFFRPFDDHVSTVGSAHKDSNNHSVRHTPEGSSAENRREAVISSSISSHDYSQPLSQTDSISSCGSNTSLFSANILSIPSVKVHPQHWTPSFTQHHDSLSQRLPSSLPPSSVISASSVSATASTDAPPVLPTLQLAGVVSEITTADDMPASNPFLPTISRCITDRIERFDFKSLARECTASAPSTNPTTLTVNLKRPISKLDRREAAFRIQKRRRKLGVDTDGTMSSFIHNGEECGDEEEERMMTRLTMISRASPIALDEDSNKLNLFGYLGLTTCKRKRELEIKKERRRRCKLRMASLSPVRCHLDTTDVFDPSPHPLISPTTSQSDVFKGEEDNEHKKERNDENKSTFLAFVGLRRISHHKKTELSKQRKLNTHPRWKNGFAMPGAKQNSSDNENIYASSSSLKLSSTTVLETVPSLSSSSLCRDPSQQHQYLISAGLATEVRSLHGSHGSNGMNAELDKEPLRSDGVPTLSSQLFIPQNSFAPGPGPIPVHPSFPGNTGSGKASVDERGSLTVASNSRPNLSGEHIGLQLQHHLYTGRPGIPTAAVSGCSQGSGTSREPDSRYQLLQASQQDLAEAESLMNRHMTMWTDRLAEADRRNAALSDTRTKSNSQQ